MHYWQQKLLLSRKIAVFKNYFRKLIKIPYAFTPAYFSSLITCHFSFTCDALVVLDQTGCDSPQGPCHDIAQSFPTAWKILIAWQTTCDSSWYNLGVFFSRKFSINLRNHRFERILWQVYLCCHITLYSPISWHKCSTNISWMRLSVTYQITPTSRIFLFIFLSPLEPGGDISDEIICLVCCSIPGAWQGVATWRKFTEWSVSNSINQGQICSRLVYCNNCSILFVQPR